MSMTYKEKEEYQKTLDKVTSMSVDKFQTEYEKHFVRDWTIDNMIFDLAKALMKTSHGI
jgi:hypothetical protein